MGPKPAPSLSEAAKRSLFFSTRVRFAPNTQHLRNLTIDKIIEQGFLIAESESGLTEMDLEHSGALALGSGFLALNHLDIHNSIDRLFRSSRLIKVAESPSRYRLSDVVRIELMSQEQAAQRRLDAVVSRVFVGVNSKTYLSPFLDLLCQIFSELGETYIRCLQGDHLRDELLQVPNLKRTIDAICVRSPVDRHVFANGVLAFFSNGDVDYEIIKWTFAQNAYAAKTIGLDPSSHYFSASVFGNSIIYLDTNVVVNVLEPLGRHHQALQMLRKACERLGIDLRVCQVSLEEMRNVVEGHRQLLARVADAVPESLACKIRGVFFAMYWERRQKSEPVALDELFDRFDAPATKLADEHGIATIDDVWFHDRPAADCAVLRFAEEIMAESRRRRPLYPKRRAAAIHDARLLKWIERERAAQGRNVWLLTLDSLLPCLLEAPQPDGIVRPVAVTLDALLQWISLVTIHDSGEEAQFAAIFSDAIKYMILPQDKVYSLEDFAILADMERDAKLMPVEDIEGALRTMQMHAPSLDLTNPRDREQMSYELSKFVKGTGRKFKEELAKQAAETEEAREQARVERREAEEHRLSDIHELQDRQKIELESLMSFHGEDRRNWERQLEGLRAELEAVKAQREADQRASALRELKRSAYTRFWFAAVLFVVLMVGCASVALRFGHPVDDFQKLKDAGGLFVGATVIWGVLAVFIIGSRQRALMLSWPIRRLLGVDRDTDREI